MDTRRMVIGFSLAMTAIIGWQLVVAYIYKQHPEWRPKPVESAQVEPPSSTAPATSSTTQPLVESPAAATQATTAVASDGLTVSSSTMQPQAVTLGASDEFPIKLDLTARGAAISLATLKKFNAPDRKGPYVFQEPPAHDKSRASLATRSIMVDGQTIDLKDAVWTLSKSDARTAEFTLDLLAKGEPAVRLIKAYTLHDATTASKGFIVDVQHSIQSLTDRPLSVRLTYDGPTLPPRELLSGPDLQIVAGYDDEQQIAAQAHYTTEFVKDRVKQDLLTRGGEGKTFVWAGAASVYFEALIRPLPDEGSETGGVPIAKNLQSVQAEALSPDASADHRDLAITIETKDLSVPATAALTLRTELFLGPKQRELLNSDFYTQYPRSYNKTLVIQSGPCSICTFSFLIDALVKLLALFHTVCRDWGLAIICLVILVRSILHPITKRSQVSMMKMGKMGPEVEKLKKKYGEDKDALNKAMMELYKTQGATPILGCLPMFLQMPIWIALWASLQSTFELRQAPFLWGFTWIDDLAKPDLLIDFGKDIKLFFGLHLAGINLLPILMGIVFFLQQKLTPKPPAANEQQEQQQKMMQWMSLLFPVFLYNGPSGLNLYILTSTTIGIIESKIVRDHIKQQEEREKAGPIIIDAPPEPKKKPRDDEGGQGARRKLPEPKPKSGLAGILGKLQAKAEEIRKEAEGRKK